MALLLLSLADIKKKLLYNQVSWKVILGSEQTKVAYTIQVFSSSVTVDVHSHRCS